MSGEGDKDAERDAPGDPPENTKAQENDGSEPKAEAQLDADAKGGSEPTPGVDPGDETEPAPEVEDEPLDEAVDEPADIVAAADTPAEDEDPGDREANDTDPDDGDPIDETGQDAPAEQQSEADKLLAGAVAAAAGVPVARRRRTQPRAITGRLSRAAQAGQAFEAFITDPTGLDAVEPHGIEEHGLTLDRDPDTGEWRVSGQLDAPGVYEIILAARIGSDDVAVSLRLNVSPDPWSIWKDLDVDWDELPYPKDDVASARIKADLTLTYASRRGRSHAHKALPRDDDGRIRFDPVAHWHIGVVADGAGSAPYSRKGSEIAVQTVYDALPQLLERHARDAETGVDAGLQTALHEAALLASKAVDTFAEAEGHARRDFSTTLLLGVARAMASGGWLFASFSVGDGAIALLGDDPQESPLMISADSGEFAGQTVFLDTALLEARDSAKARFHCRQAPDFTAFLLATDGISDAWFPSDAAMNDPANWARLWADEIAPANALGAQALADWLNFKVKGEHDDRTLVIMTPPAATDPTNPE